MAFAVEHEEIRRYKVNRIEAADITPFVFQRPDDFDIVDLPRRLVRDL